MAVDWSSEPEARMERREGNETAFQSIYISRMSYPTYRVCVCVCMCAQLCLTGCDPMECSPPGSSVYGIF